MADVPDRIGVRFRLRHSHRGEPAGARGRAAALSLPWYAVLDAAGPLAAGMTLLDTIDGCFMNVAYGWAASTPVRKIFYNLTVTGLSVAVALIIGTIQLMSLVADRLGVTHGPLAYLANLDLAAFGLVIVLAFVGIWALRWRCGASGGSSRGGHRRPPAE